MVKRAGKIPQIQKEVGKFPQSRKKGVEQAKHLNRTTANYFEKNGRR